MRCLATRIDLFGKGVIVKTPGVRHSAGHSEFPYPRCPRNVINPDSELVTARVASPLHNASVPVRLWHAIPTIAKGYLLDNLQAMQ
jgi:hypothetical protein